MKALLLSVLVLSSFNIFAAEVGESKAVECEFANQGGRAQKESQVQSTKDDKKVETNSVSK